MRIKDNVKSVYTQIIVLCEIFHISFLFIFKHFSMQIPFMYNIGSVIFYILMLFVVLKGYYRVCIVLIDVIGVFNSCDTFDTNSCRVESMTISLDIVAL